MKIIDSILERWSPRAFDNKKVNDDLLYQLFEAARWSPSSMNEQPWSYYYSRKGEDGFERMLDCLVPQNREWGKEASVLVLSVATRNFKYKNRTNRHAMHDTGAANAIMAVQASALGLQVHQMGGFDMEKTMSSFNLSSEDYEPASFIAIGYPGNPDSLSEDLRERELSPRTRKKRISFLM